MKIKGSRVNALLLLSLIFFLVLNTYCFRLVEAQPKDIRSQGSGFNIYVNGTGGLAFQSRTEDATFTIEVLSGEWNGTSCSLGVTERGGNLYFYSNSLAYVQLSHNFDYGMRLQYEGIQLTTLDPSHSWNGTIPAATDVYLDWSFAIKMIHEENFMLFVGLSGVGLLVISILLLAWSIKKYPLFSMEKKSFFEADIFPFIAGGLVIGSGLIIIWLMS